MVSSHCWLKLLLAFQLLGVDDGAAGYAIEEVAAPVDVAAACRGSSLSHIAYRILGFPAFSWQYPYFVCKRGLFQGRMQRAIKKSSIANILIFIFQQSLLCRRSTYSSSLLPKSSVIEVKVLLHGTLLTERMMTWFSMSSAASDTL